MSGVAVVALGLLTGPATAATAPTLATARARRGRRLFGAGVLLLLMGWVLVCLQAVTLLAQVEIGNSQDAVGRGDTRAALADARKARNIQPWASSPYLQLAFVAEQEGDLATARGAIGDAIERDRRNWRLRLVAARLDTKAGAFPAAAASLARGETAESEVALILSLFANLHASGG